MAITVSVSRLGNSKGFRIPQSILKSLNADNVGDEFSLSVEDNKIVLEKQKEPDVIDELFKGFDPDKYYKNHDVPEMVDWGKPQGREIF